MAASQDESRLLRCYNVACGKMFSESDNFDDACVYHSGHPVFHDAYKSWSCCSKRTTDFTEFLNFPGCCRGKHSNVKPDPVKTPVAKTNEKEESDTQEIVHKPINLNEPIARPSEDSPLVNLLTKISPNLKDQLDKLMKDVHREEDLGESSNSTKVEIGTSCKNSGCKKSYEGPESDQEECLLHPGAPIFHEGMKFWSCCNRKTTDFETFLSQEGCQSGKHLWFKVKPKVDSDESRRTSCRFDWHQTGNDVVLTIYSKQPIPEKCEIKANQVKLEIKITFNGQEEKLFIHNFTLFNAIDTDNSLVEFTPSKVEICMRKADKSYWKKLTFND